VTKAYPPVGAVIGRYRITGVLGHGGTGIVYAAVHEDLDRDVALKVLSPELADHPGFRRRFAREAEILSGLHSPHITDIYEHGEHEGCLYISSPLVNGGDLRRLLLAEGGLTPALGLDVVEQVGEALADAHRAGVVHRDVKPSNVLLHGASDGRWFAYLSDFGIAQSPGEERTPTEGLTGTTAYLAPERHTGAASSPAGDVYSLGCLLATVLTGRPPYVGTDVQVAAQHLHGPVPQMPGSDAAMRAVNAILLRAMAKDPADRYLTAAEMLPDLRTARMLTQGGADEVDVDRPEQTVPPRPHRRRRRPAWVAIGAAGLLVLLSLIGVGGYTWTQERQPRCEGLILPNGECRAAPDRESDQRTQSFTCWDGRPVRRKSLCTDPAGTRGLQWVFPSFERDLSTCRRRVDLTVDPSLRSWRCETPGAGPPAVQYTEWLSSEAAAARYRRRFDEPAVNFVVDGAAAGYQWRTSRPDANGRLRMTVAYLHWPYSATLYARTPLRLDRLCSTVVGRSPMTFRQGPIDCSPPRRPIR
jgi:hypothetical protein